MDTSHSIIRHPSKTVDWFLKARILNNFHQRTLVTIPGNERNVACMEYQSSLALGITSPELL